jgi:tetratricopeptide (TPR) repeat protein
MNQRHPGWSAVLASAALLVVLTAMIAETATASPQSQELTAQGKTELVAGHVAAALAKAQAAVQADATDADAQILLGRAYLATRKDDDKATAAFDEAVRLDPQLAPRLIGYRALIAVHNHNSQDLPNLMQQAPAFSVGLNSQNLQNLRDRLGAGNVFEPNAPLNLGVRGARAESDPFQITASAGAGYNSNALFVGDNLPLPVESDRKGSAFANFQATAVYSWRPRNNNSYDVGYSFNGDFYKDIPEADLTDHYLFGDFQHSFNQRLSAGLRLSEEYTTIDGDRYRNRLAINPTLVFRRSQKSATVLSYTLASNNYAFDGASVQNRDGTEHTLALTEYFSPSKRTQVRGGAFYELNRADGDDYDFHSLGLFAGIRHALPWKVTGDLSYTYSLDRYDHDNSLSNPAFSEKRHDDVSALSLQLTRPLKKGGKSGLDAYFRYAYNRDNSNLDFFRYHQNIISIGVLGSF